MDRLQIDTSQNVAIDVPLAGLGDRLIAAIIDYVILGAYVLTLSLVVGFVAVQSENVYALGTLFLLGLLPVLLYFLLCEVFLDGQSIGKRIMDIRVTRRDGTPASLGNYVVRWLLRPIDITITGGLGAVLSILISGTGQRLGDLAAGTTVVKVDARVSIEDLAITQNPPDSTVHFPEADHLSDEDVVTAQQVLAVVTDRRPSDRQKDLARRTQQALSQKMGISSDLPPRDFLEAVVQSYNHHDGTASSRA